MTQPTAAPPKPRSPSRAGRLPLIAFWLSLLVVLPPVSLLGSVLGIVALVRIGGDANARGKRLAVAAIALGVASTLATLWVAVYVMPRLARREETRAWTGEAQGNLRGLFVAERNYELDHDVYAADFATLGYDFGFELEPDNRYAYFLAASGPVEKRGKGHPKAPAHPVVIGVSARWSAGGDVTTLVGSGCPLSLKRAGSGPALTVGVSGSGADRAVVLVAAGNIDDDPLLDCWSIATVDRVGPDGERVPAGVALHEQDDSVLP